MPSREFGDPCAPAMVGPWASFPCDLGWIAQVPQTRLLLQHGRSRYRRRGLLTVARQQDPCPWKRSVSVRTWVSSGLVTRVGVDECFLGSDLGTKANCEDPPRNCCDLPCGGRSGAFTRRTMQSTGGQTPSPAAEPAPPAGGQGRPIRIVGLGDGEGCAVGETGISTKSAGREGAFRSLRANPSNCRS